MLTFLDVSKGSRRTAEPSDDDANDSPLSNNDDEEDDDEEDAAPPLKRKAATIDLTHEIETPPSSQHSVTKPSKKQKTSHDPPVTAAPTHSGFSPINPSGKKGVRLPAPKKKGSSARVPPAPSPAPSLPPSPRHAAPPAKTGGAAPPLLFRDLAQLRAQGEINEKKFADTTKRELLLLSYPSTLS